MIKRMVAASLALNVVAQTCYTASDQFFGSKIGKVTKTFCTELLIQGLPYTTLRAIVSTSASLRNIPLSFKYWCKLNPFRKSKASMINTSLIS